MRNKLGKFIKGHKEDFEIKKKRIVSLKDSWKLREDYLGDIKNNPLYNVWRGFMFTKKGKSSGHSNEWSEYKNFYNDMSESYEKGLRLSRIDKSLPFCKENCLWLTDSQLSLTKSNNVKLEYNSEIKTLQEWANIYNLEVNAIRLRYHRGWENPQEIIFGRPIQRKKKIKDYSEYSLQGKKDKISKMISSYRCKDKKRGFITDLTNEWFYENIITKPCTYCGSLENVGCDRIDNTLGHSKNNVLPCCYICNVTRHEHFSVEEMKLLGETIKLINKNRLNK